MFFEVDIQSGKPVYQQLIDQVKLAVASGRLREGDKLPSIREVAVELRLNRNTVARVFAELEREGVVYTRPGAGCFVGGRGSVLSDAAQREDLVTRTDAMLAQARLYGYGRREVRSLLSERIETIYGGPRAEEESQR